MELRNYHLVADKHKLGQVVRNLVSNALKFTPSGGNVIVRLSRVMHDSHPNRSKNKESAAKGFASYWGMFPLFYMLKSIFPLQWSRDFTTSLPKVSSSSSSDECGQQMLRIEVIDSGAGISKVCFELYIS